MRSRNVPLAWMAGFALLTGSGVSQERTTPHRVSPPEKTFPSTPNAAPKGGTPQDLQIGAGDLLDVTLYGIPEFKSEVRVSSDGKISLPMIGNVDVDGLTVERAAASIEKRLKEKGLYNDPHINIFVREYATQGISVLGEVQKPGIYPLLGSRKLYDAMSAAGGTTPKAGRYVLITHKNDPQHPVRVPLTTGSPESMEHNVPVEPGDTILVGKAGVVYVVGDVRQPGGFVMENGNSITVLQAIALAQGTNPNAALNSAKLIRKSPEGQQDLPIELKKILTAKAPDLQLQPDDIIFVPNSAGKSATKRGLEAIIQMATGVAIWRVP
ncbi:MAG: polysaccharide biosynthesis/export family protein [Acidobacteria bacterium]|nr:polysaccharide biosynthesis/export family protein [Acidobacteriota bacterium]